MIQTLDDSAYVYCFKVCKRVLESYAKPDIKDYPPMLVACSLKNESCIGIAREPIEYVQPMKDRLENRLGDIIGKPSPNTGLPFPIGNCAEPHAANEILERTTSSTDKDIGDIVFSRAIRPRTKMTYQYCKNCLLTFDQLKNE